MRRITTVLVAALVAGLFVGRAVADQTDPRLDGLFGQLQAAASSLESLMLEARIWSTWLQTESPTIDLLMRQALEAMSLDRYQDSFDILSKVVEIAPDYAEGWNKRATVLFLMRRYGESIEDVERTLALEPRHFGALSGLGLIHNALDDDARALAAFERALAVNPHLRHARAEVKRLRKKVRGEKI